MTSYWDRVEHIYKMDLPRTQRDLLLYLVHRASFKTWRCKVSIPTILKETSLSRSAFFKARKTLREKALLRWTQTKIDGLHFDTDEYLILPGGRCKNRPRGVGLKTDRKPTTIRTQWTHCIVCSKFMRTRKAVNLARCRDCMKLERSATPADVVLLFPESRRV